MRYAVWMVNTPGGPFQRIERESKPLAGNEVLVRISASGVNPLDIKVRAAKSPHHRQPLPAVLGVDMAGTIVEVGPGVDAFRPGDEVYGMVGGVGGLQGTLAEFIAADADLVARKPKNLSHREAAALPACIITAWEGLVDRANVRARQKVLIHAGAGGVGHLAIQLARAFGAEVFATVSLEKKHVVESFGASPIDYRSVPVSEYVTASTGGTGFDIVYDTIGGSTLDASFEAVKIHTGHVVSCLGWGTHALAPLSFRGATYSGVFALLSIFTGEGRAHQGEILSKATELVEAGRLRPLLNERMFSTREIAEAHDVVQAGSLGKVVISIQR